jgi:ABC-type polysaccharide/polyol phosphate transport system ATPase subunit
MISEDYAIKVQGLCKTFKVYPSPKKMLKELLCGGKEHEDFHALRDISFEVKRGEVMGVMGRNGAGKSTLLRILAGTLNPTGGMIDVRGKVSAILELGTGFNPEYTGRENIVSGGLVLGMSKAEIAQKMDAIIDFSELEEFIDRPFKTYSSGMQARLTFATAISVNPDVLIVDEALAVGDARFQAKCYAKILEFRDNGGSIFLVSHSENIIVQFCDRVLLLEKGRIIMDAPPRDVAMVYCDMVWAKKEVSSGDVSSSFSSENCRMAKNGQSVQGELDGARSAMKLDALERLGITQFAPYKNSRRLGTAEIAEILAIKIYDERGESLTRLVSGRKYSFVMTIIAYEDVEKLSYGFEIRTLSGISMFGSSAHLGLDKNQSIKRCRRGEILNLNFDLDINLTNNSFLVTLSVVDLSNSGVVLDGYYDGVCIDLDSDAKTFSQSLVKMNCNFYSEILL